MKKLRIALVCALLVFASGCVAHTLEETTYPVYFLDQTQDGAQALKAESRTLDGDQDVVEGLIQALLEGPRSETLAPTIPDSVLLRSWELNNGLLTVDLSARYGRLSGIDLTLADYSIVLTLTQLEEVEAVMITVEGELLDYRDHQRLTAEDVQGAILGTETQENQG